MVNTLPAHYDPDASRAILDARGIEVENPYVLPSRMSRDWVRCAKDLGFKFSENVAHSVYVEVVEEFEGVTRPTLGLLQNQITLRVRRGGDSAVIDKETGASRVDETFPNQFALKRQDVKFQAAASEVARRIHPAAENLGVYPYIRVEVEGAHEHPDASVEMRLKDLPKEEWDENKSIRSTIEGFIQQGAINGVRRNKDLVLRPIVTTTVKRQRTLVFIDPLKPVDFKKNWPSSTPTPEMIKTGVWLCLEVAVDECANRRPPKDATIGDVVNAQNNDFSTFKKLKRIPLFEYEMKWGKHGPKTTDTQAIDAYIKFGLALRDYTKSKWDYDLQPTRSKSINAIGGLAECSEGGRLNAVYQAALPFAP